MASKSENAPESVVDPKVADGSMMPSKSILNARESADAFSATFANVMGIVSKSRVTSESGNTPIFFPGGINHLEIEVTLPTTFKLIISANKPAASIGATAGVDISSFSSANQADDQLPDYLSEAIADTVPEEVELAAAAAPAVSTLLSLPATGLYGTHTSERRYGTRRTIDALLAIGQTFSSQHNGLRIGIGDISKNGGGPISGHASHRKGVDVDVRLLRNDGKESGCRYQDGVYSRTLTQALVNAFRQNAVLPVKMIFFNDPQVTGVQPWPNHDNHLHVRFELA